VKSVGLTASATDFTVSGSTVTTTGTLNIAWTVAPTSADTANAIVKRDGIGNFSANTVSAVELTASKTVLANVVSAFDVSASDASQNATTIFGQASSTCGDAWGVEGRPSAAPQTRMVSQASLTQVAEARLEFAGSRRAVPRALACGARTEAKVALHLISTPS
jgi:hypothetical protein